MAVQRHDPLAKILGDARVNSRRETVLWLYLVSLGVPLNPDEFGELVMRDRMAEFLNRRSDLVAGIPSILSRTMLRDEHLTWIKDDERQHQWLITRFQQTFSFNAPNPPANLFGKALVIAMIDIWNTDLNTKASSIKNFENDWKQQKQQDRVFKWFQDKDEAQRCALAWDWLRKNKPPTFGTTPISSYNELLMLSDRTQWSEVEKAHCVETCRKRWNQQQYRENLKGKKQCNFVLSEKVIQQLDQLAEIYDLKRPQILEVLIKMEVEMNTYLPEKMKRLRI